MVTKGFTVLTSGSMVGVFSVCCSVSPVGCAVATGVDLLEEVHPKIRVNSSVIMRVHLVF